MIRSLLVVVLATPALAADPPPLKTANGGDAELVRRVITARKNYQQSLIDLYAFYAKSGDKQRAKWAEDELKAYFLPMKHSYRLDIQDVPPPTLEPRTNSPEANDLYKLAADYKAKNSSGDEYILNQRRAEILFQDILQKHPDSDKIADVAYELGDLYEGRTYKQFDRAAAYYERAYQWRRGTITDSRLRAARLYDKTLGDRSKAIELYRDILVNDTDKARLEEATRRLGELTGSDGRR